MTTAHLSSSAVITVFGVSVYLGVYRTPLKGVSLDVQRGELFGVLGPKGSGKSTLLKVIAGRMPATVGKVRVSGRPPRRRAVQARIAYVPAAADKFNNSTFLQKLGRLVGVNAAQKSVACPRTALIVACARKADILILDEPLSGAELAERKELNELFLDLARAGKTVILSAGVFSDAADICDRIAILSGGELTAIGATEEFLVSTEMFRHAVASMPESLTDGFRIVAREHFYDKLVERKLRSDQRKAGAQTAPEDPLRQVSAPGEVKSEKVETVHDSVDHEKLARLTKTGL